MGKAPSPFSGWPQWLVLLIAVIGPPTAVTAFLPTLTHNPWLAGSLLLAYELFVVLVAFLKKIWEKRADPWAEASASYLERRLRLLFAGAPRRYRRFFRYEHSDLDMKGISTRGTYTLDLEQVFVEVRIDPTPAHKVS